MVEGEDIAHKSTQQFLCGPFPLLFLLVTLEVILSCLQNVLDTNFGQFVCFVVCLFVWGKHHEILFVLQYTTAWGTLYVRSSHVTITLVVFPV